MPTAAPVAPRRRPRSSRAARENRAGYGFIAPWLVGLAVFVVGPMAASLYFAFTDYNLLQPPQFIGIQNFVQMFTEDPRYMNAVRVTLTYVAVSVPLQLLFALLLALLLNRAISGVGVYRAAFYLPSLIGGSVAVAVLWRQVFGRGGLLNQALGALGVDAATSWIGNPETALWTLVILNVWTFGSPMVIFLAGLRQIPSSLYEAAAVDGASPARQFLNITLPLLTPIVFFNIILQTIAAFQAFVPAYIISGGRGGPADSTLFYTLYLYQRGFASFDMGYASAMAWILLLTIAIVTAAHFLFSRYWVFYGDDEK